MSIEKKIAVIVCYATFIFNTVVSQSRWDGEGGDNKWSNPLNWDNNSVPLATDSVLLDNSIWPGSYSVELPQGVLNTSIATIVIRPGDSNIIRFILPSTNTAIPGLSVTGVGGIRLYAGSEFQNSSGGSPGLALAITDSMYIFNGGHYIHNTSNAHAAFVTKLSRRIGTEQGSFEFNVPGAASYTVSLVSRVYGNLILNSAAAGGNKSYLSSGSSNAFINGDCRINSGVNFSLDFTATITIKGSLINNGNFNLATGANNNVVKIGKEFVCSGIVTESSAGLPVLELNGNIEQLLTVTGSIINNVGLRLNTSIVRLIGPVLLPYKLELIRGRLISSASAILTLASSCTISADSTSSDCFIDGPLRKLGLVNGVYFHFPVGKGNAKRWLSANGISGDLTVEYFKINPNNLSPMVGPGLDHVSRLEYWAITSASGVSCHPELSFDNANSGGVTNLSNLRVARLGESQWIDNGNIATTGSAGSSGSVTGMHTILASNTVNYFTLASDASNHNPLPLTAPPVFLGCRNEKLFINWPPGLQDRFWKIELEKMGSGNQFMPVQEKSDVHSGSWVVDEAHSNTDIFRLTMYQRDGGPLITKQLHPRCSCGRLRIRACLPGENAVIVESDSSRNMKIVVVGMDGKTASISNVFLLRGRHKISLSLTHLAAGYYQVFGLSSAARTNPFLFFKP